MAKAKIARIRGFKKTAPLSQTAKKLKSRKERSTSIEQSVEADENGISIMLRNGDVIGDSDSDSDGDGDSVEVILAKKRARSSAIAEGAHPQQARSDAATVGRVDLTGDVDASTTGGSDGNGNSSGEAFAVGFSHSDSDPVIDNQSDLTSDSNSTQRSSSNTTSSSQETKDDEDGEESSLDDNGSSSNEDGTHHNEHKAANQQDEPSPAVFPIVASTDLDIFENTKRMEQIRNFVESIVKKMRRDRKNGAIPSSTSGPCRGKLNGYLPSHTTATPSAATQSDRPKSLYIKTCVDRWLVEYGDITEPDDEDWMQINKGYQQTFSDKSGIGAKHSNTYLEGLGATDDESSASEVLQSHKKRERDDEIQTDDSDICEIVAVLTSSGQKKQTKQRAMAKSTKALSPLSPQRRFRKELYDTIVSEFHIPRSIRERMDSWEYYYERLEEMEGVLKALIAANNVSSEFHAMLDDNLDDESLEVPFLAWQQKQECIIRYLSFLVQTQVLYVQQLAMDHQEGRNRQRALDRRRKQRQRRKQDLRGRPRKTELDKESFMEIYQDTMSSFRLFCPNCLEYCCSLHGILPESDTILRFRMAKLRHSRLYQSEALEATDNGDGKKPAPQPMYPEQGAPVTPLFPDDHTLSEDEITTCQSLWYLFDGNVQQVAEATRIPLDAIEKQISFLPLPGLPYTLEPPADKKRRKNHYHNNMDRHCQKAALKPHPFPCYHEESGLCTKENCSCVSNGFFCTRRCGFAEFSPNFFRGCTCQGRCDNNSCPCFAAKRECDPNLCKTCGTCSEPPGRPAMIQQCRNDNVTMRRHPLLCKGESDIMGANYGCFPMEEIKEGQFVDSYMGELISQDKADDLGNKVYDEINSTYIFDLTVDMVLDAYRMGNMARLINHEGASPNVQPDTWFVQGDPKIALYATRDIQIQEELFFNYGDKFHGEFLPHQKKKDS